VNTNHDLNFVGKFALSELPREKGYKVVLTGEGADEIFAGYPLYLPDFLREADNSWHGPGSVIPEAERQRMCAEAEELTANVYQAIGADWTNRGDNDARRLLNGITTPASMCAFQFDAFTEWAKEAYRQNPQVTIAKVAEDLTVDRYIQKRWHPLLSALYVWTRGHLVNSFLSCLEDRTEMAHSIEARPGVSRSRANRVRQLAPPKPKDSLAETFRGSLGGK
jgi:asparagine synthase (glutamine-hydrolysing)